MLKAGGHWNAKLTVPEAVRDAAGGPKSRESIDGHPRSFTWFIEVSSQILFSTSASVHYEVLVGRDERSLDLGIHGISNSPLGIAGKLEDHQGISKHNPIQTKGVYSKAVHLSVHDTQCLWNTPEFPSWDDDLKTTHQKRPQSKDSMSSRKEARRKQKRKKIHLVVLTHGLHSNVGADLLYLKESIDATAKEAREAARRAKALEKEERRQAKAKEDTNEASSKSMPALPSAPEDLDEDDSDDEEQVIVRGFSGNTVKTERGIQYLGKRLAKYVLSITYPDQPYLPVKSSISKSVKRSLSGKKTIDPGHTPAHKGSSIHRDDDHSPADLAYQITSISFVAHSLGGVVQTYAIAYINKHSPDFFDLIKPVNFVALAAPFLGLSNENPIYIKFALDFGLVGRTGQDLGLTWRAPAALRSGWGAMIGGIGRETPKEHQPDPSSKPLLRILPTGPAHSALKKFRNRTVYSNVVNDGIVPLRTSCLLFLDWRGLERVEKARRETGLVGTMASWGLAELTGQNASSPRSKSFWNDIFSDNDSDSNVAEPQDKQREEVPQPDEEATKEDNIMNSEIQEPKVNQFINKKALKDGVQNGTRAHNASPQQPPTPWASLMSLFKSNDPKPSRSNKSTKAYQRGQTMMIDQQEQGSSDASDVANAEASTSRARPVRPVRGSSLYATESSGDGLQAPPRTTIFESAGDLLNPPLPSKDFIIDPAARPRTIFHDRIYHPQDIPAPPVKKRSGISRSFSLDSPRSNSGTNLSNTGVNQSQNNGEDTSQTPTEGAAGGMKVEEKIARAYHHELSWRKVLVRLEPDAHNNLIVRRKFANAYGWPVVKHLCDTHFAFTAAAQTEDKYETNEERAKPSGEGVGPGGESVTGQEDPPSPTQEQPHRRNSADDKRPLIFHPPEPGQLRRTDSEVRESRDAITALKSPTASNSYSSKGTSSLHRSDSARWSDRYFEGSDDDSDLDIEASALARRNIDTRTAPEPKVADVLTSSPKHEKSLSLSSTAESEQAEGSRGGGEHQAGAQQAALDQATLGMTGLGIGVAPTDTHATQGRREQPHLGVAEQVAFAQSKKKEQDDDA